MVAEQNSFSTFCLSAPGRNYVCEHCIGDLENGYQTHQPERLDTCQREYPAWSHAVLSAQAFTGYIANFAPASAEQLFGEHIFLDRLVLYQETDKLIAPLPVRSMDALEISGDRWAGHGFRSYVSANYPDYDVCGRPLDGSFDIIIAEQVFEHLLWPHRAAKNVFAMLRPGGYFFLATPFLLRVHEIPVDCSRWTETGLKYLLADSGFNLEDIKTGSWGNVSAAKANLRRNSFPAYYRHVSDLKNDPMFPVQVWALARKA